MVIEMQINVNHANSDVTMSVEWDFFFLVFLVANYDFNISQCPMTTWRRNDVRIIGLLLGESIDYRKSDSYLGLQFFGEADKVLKK